MLKRRQMAFKVENMRKSGNIKNFKFFECIFCRRQTEKIFYSSKDIFEKLKIFNDARFSHIFNFKSHMKPFKRVGFFKIELKRFN